MKNIKAYDYLVIAPDSLIQEIQLSFFEDIKWGNFKEGDIFYNDNGEERYVVAEIDRTNKIISLEDKNIAEVSFVFTSTNGKTSLREIIKYAIESVPGIAARNNVLNLSLDNLVFEKEYAMCCIDENVGAGYWNNGKYEKEITLIFEY